MLNNIIFLILSKSLIKNKNVNFKQVSLKNMLTRETISILTAPSHNLMVFYDLSMFRVFFNSSISLFNNHEVSFSKLAKVTSSQSINKVLQGILLFSDSDYKNSFGSNEKMLVLNKLLGLLAKEYTGFFTEWKFLNIHPETLAERYIFTLNSIQRRSAIRFLKMNRAVYYNMIVSLTLMRDPTLLVILIQKLFINTVVKRHRPLFMRVKRFLSIWYILSKYRRTVLGYSFYFKGKLGKKGSVRKRKIFSKNGQISFTNKNVRVNYKNYIIWTDTGCVGANISIFYNVYVYATIIIHMMLFSNNIHFILLFSHF